MNHQLLLLAAIAIALIAAAWHRQRSSKGTYDACYNPLVNEPRDFTNEQEAREWLDAEFGAWAQALTAEQRDALRSYKGLAYQEINEAARTGFERPEQALLDAAIEAHTLTESVVAYRGLVDPDAGLHLLYEGDEITDDGYWSLALLQHTAVEFTTAATRPETAIVLRVALDAGVHAIRAAAPDQVEDMHENELLLARGSRFRLADDPVLQPVAETGGRGHYIIDVEVST